MVGLETDIGQERLVFARIRVHVLNGAIDKILRGIKLGWHLGPLPVFKPINLGQMGQVLLVGLPVVRTGIALDNGFVKATLIGQVVGLGAHIPFARDIGAVTAVLQERGHRHHIAGQRSLVPRFTQMLGRHGFAQIANAVAVVVHASQQHRARGRARGGHMEIGKTQTGFG